MRADGQAVELATLALTLLPFVMNEFLQITPDQCSNLEDSHHATILQLTCHELHRGASSNPHSNPVLNLNVVTRRSPLKPLSKGSAPLNNLSQETLAEAGLASSIFITLFSHRQPSSHLRKHTTKQARAGTALQMHERTT